MPGDKWTKAQEKKLVQDWNESDDKTMYAFALTYSGEGAQSEYGIYYKMKELKRRGKIKDKTQTVPNPRILYFDIETLPLISYSWGIWDQNIQTDNVIKDWCILSWAAQWEGDKAVSGSVLTQKEAQERDDERLISSMWQLLERADMVVSQNGRKFDHKRLNARFIHYKKGMPKPYKTVDTLVEARKIAAFTSNRLDWLAQETGVATRKCETGMELWRACDAGDKKSLDKMLEYNMGDVKELREVYKELAPYMPNHPNINLYAVMPQDNCRVCSGEIKDIGRGASYARRKRAWRCVDCGSVGV